MLYPYQEKGADWLASRSAALLADEMGLGKTPQAIHAAARRCAITVRVLCRAFLRSNWLHEISIHDPAPSARTWVVMSHHEARTQAPVPCDLLIVDEAQDLRTPTSALTRAVYGRDSDRASGWAASAGAVWLLSGTPTPNNPLEIWTHLRALAPDSLPRRADGGPCSYFGFRAIYTTFITLPMVPPRVRITGAKNSDDLRQRFAPFVLRRLARDALNLPPLRFGDLVLEASADGVRQVQVAERDLSADALCALIGSKVPDDISSLRRLHAMVKAPVLASIVAGEIADDATAKHLIFGWHVDALILARDRLDELGMGPGMITGAVPMAERDAIVSRFNSDPACRVLVLQIAAAGVGLNLTAASGATFLEMSWVPADNMQAAKRLHRIGQTRSVLVRAAMLAGSTDEAVTRSLRQKTAMVRTLIGEDTA